jgi:hypothetical protein
MVKAHKYRIKKGPNSMDLPNGQKWKVRTSAFLKRMGWDSVKMPDFWLNAFLNPLP